MVWKMEGFSKNRLIRIFGQKQRKTTSYMVKQKIEFFLKNQLIPIFDQNHKKCLNPERSINTPVLAGVTGRWIAKNGIWDENKFLPWVNILYLSFH